jgi:ABC-type Fe3+/spermidine/putrescine transport system ATPase subunit
VDVVGPGRVRLGDAVLDVPGAVTAGKATLVVRPETITLTATPPQDAGRPVLRGRIKTSAFLGVMARYWVEALGMEWIIDQPAPGEGMFGGEVSLVLSPDRMHVLSADRATASEEGEPPGRTVS